MYWQQHIILVIKNLKVIKTETWELVEKLKNRRLVDYKWIFKIQEGLTNSESRRYKARLMARNFTQKEWL